MNVTLLSKRIKPFLKSACKVRHYPKREEIEQEVVDFCPIKFSWLQGAGLNLSICGYLTQQTIMLEFQYVAYLQIFGRVYPDLFINKRIGLSTNMHDVFGIVPPFLEQLSLLVSCRFGTVEVLWMYYCTVAQANQHEKSCEQSRQKSHEQSRFLKSTTQPSRTPLADCLVMTADDSQYLLSVLSSELSDEHVERIVLLVKDAYRMCIEWEHTGFVVIHGYLLGRTIMH